MNLRQIASKAVNLVREAILHKDYDSAGAVLYIDLLKKSILNLPHIENEPPYHKNMSKSEQREKRKTGREWPTVAFTMIGEARCNNVHKLLEDVIVKDVPGDFLEAGVWRGGACILARSILKVYGDKSRKVWVCDSFEGLPKPREEEYPEDKGDKHHTVEFLSVGLDQVKDNFRKYDLLDDQVVFVKGWFHETLPNVGVKKISVLRLDGDMYESTISILNNLYDEVSVGGYIIVDDYGAIPACKKAIHDFREARSIQDEIVKVDWTGVYWRKSSY